MSSLWINLKKYPSREILHEDIGELHPKEYNNWTYN